eukprot:3877925-Rhodomonas_salina.1
MRVWSRLRRSCPVHCAAICTRPKPPNNANLNANARNKCRPRTQFRTTRSVFCLGPQSSQSLPHESALIAHSFRVSQGHPRPLQRPLQRPFRRTNVLALHTAFLSTRPPLFSPPKYIYYERHSTRSRVLCPDPPPTPGPLPPVPLAATLVPHHAGFVRRLLAGTTVAVLGTVLIGAQYHSARLGLRGP